MGSAAWWQLAVAPTPSVWEREREREGSRVVENGDGQVGPAGKFKLIQNSKFLQTWFSPKVTFPDSNNSNKNIGR
jgi:hypothetical protein